MSQILIRGLYTNAAYHAFPMTSLKHCKRKDTEQGLGLLQVMGGRFRNVMPSDLFAPGAMATTSLPARGPQYATDATKKKLLELFKRYAAMVVLPFSDTLTWKIAIIYL